MNDNVKRLIDSLGLGDVRNFSTERNGSFLATVETACIGDYIKLKRGNGIIIAVNVYDIYAIERG